MKVIDLTLLDKVSSEAKESPRLRMNYNFHQSLEDKCHRMLNAVEPGTVVSIHRQPTKDESFVILRGKVRVTTHNDDGSIIEEVVLSQESGNYGVDIPKNVWHMVEALEAGGCRRVRTSLSARRIFLRYEYSRTVTVVYCFLRGHRK